MSRQLPPQVDQVKNWCLANKKFEDASFIMTIKELMISSQKITSEQVRRLEDILRLYVLDIDLQQKIKERRVW